MCDDLEEYSRKYSIRILASVSSIIKTPSIQLLLCEMLDED